MGLSRRPNCHARVGAHPVSSHLGDGEIEVIPVWVSLLDQLDLPRAVPALQLLLALNGGTNLTKVFEIDETSHTLFLGEPLRQLFSMLVEAPDKIVRHADIERAAKTARQNIDVIDALTHTATLVATGWPGQAGQ